MRDFMPLEALTKTAMKNKLKCLCTAFVIVPLMLIFFTPFSLAQDTRPYKKIPSSDPQPILTIRAEERQISLSMKDIESLPMVQTQNLVHYDGPKGRFSGIWLDDLLKKYQLNEDHRLRFSALDGYEVFITPTHREHKRFLLATRINDKAITPEDLGPLMLIIPSDIDAPPKIAASKSLWIWALNDITVQ